MTLNNSSIEGFFWQIFSLNTKMDSSFNRQFFSMIYHFTRVPVRHLFTLSKCHLTCLFGELFSKGQHTMHPLLVTFYLSVCLLYRNLTLSWKKHIGIMKISITNKLNLSNNIIILVPWPIKHVWSVKPYFFLY